MTYFMSPEANHCRRPRRGPRQKKPRGPKPNANASHPKCRVMAFLHVFTGTRCYVKILWHDISCQPRVIALTSASGETRQVIRTHKLVRLGRAPRLTRRAHPVFASDAAAAWHECTW